MKRAMSENNSDGEDNLNDGANNLSSGGGSNASGNYSNNNNRGQKRSRNEEMIRLLIPSRVSTNPYKYKHTPSTAKCSKTFRHRLDFSNRNYERIRKINRKAIECGGREREWCSQF